MQNPQFRQKEVHREIYIATMLISGLYTHFVLNFFRAALLPRLGADQPNRCVCGPPQPDARRYQLRNNGTSQSPNPQSALGRLVLIV
jgi:hypothetical protein